MKYSEWSKQYSDDAEKIRDRINELKTQQETAWKYKQPYKYIDFNVS